MMAKLWPLARRRCIFVQSGTTIALVIIAINAKVRSCAGISLGIIYKLSKFENSQMMQASILFSPIASCRIRWKQYMKASAVHGSIRSYGRSPA